MASLVKTLNFNWFFQDMSLKTEVQRCTRFTLQDVKMPQNSVLRIVANMLFSFLVVLFALWSYFVIVVFLSFFPAHLLEALFRSLWAVM